MRVSLDIPPGLFGDDTTFSAAGRWAYGDNVRFWRGRPQVIGGWELLTENTLTGVCRNVFQWSDNLGSLNIAFGTHSALHVWVQGDFATITPSGLTVGNVDGTGGAGYGTGTYGTGEWSEPSTADFFPRTWSFGAWGQKLVANPRGGNIYLWDNVQATPAATLTNAPTQVTYSLVSHTDQVFALGCNEEVSGTFNPLCIRHSSIRGNTTWNTAAGTTAREYILSGGGRIVAGRRVGKYLLVWTNHALYLGTYVGQPGEVWRFDPVGQNCGLVGPNAAVVVGQAAYWLGPDLQFRRYPLGGAVEIIPCPIREDMADNLASAQGDKIVASSISMFGEVRFDYPDARDGTENSRYLAMSLVDGAWYRGQMARSAVLDAGPSDFPIGVTPEGTVYWHERGQSADGGVFSWSIRTADQYLSEDRTGLLRGIWPDLADQVGPVNVTAYSRLKPQGDERSQGPQSMAVGEDKVDMRLSGRLFQLEFSGNSSPTAARLGKIAVDFQPMGGR